MNPGNHRECRKPSLIQPPLILGERMKSVHPSQTRFSNGLAHNRSKGSLIFARIDFFHTHFLQSSFPYMLKLHESGWMGISSTYEKSKNPNIHPLPKICCQHIQFVGLKWVHMARYELNDILRQDGARWLRIISGPLPTPKSPALWPVLGWRRRVSESVPGPDLSVIPYLEQINRKTIPERVRAKCFLGQAQT